MTSTAPYRTTAPSTARKGDTTGAVDDGWAINLFTACIVLVAVTCLDAALVHPLGPRLAVLVLTVAVIAERVGEPRAALGSTVMAFAFGDGFLQHHDGSLGWQSSVDLPFALALLGATTLGLGWVLVRRARRRHRLMAPFGALLRAAAANPSRPPVDRTGRTGGDQGHPAVKNA